MTLIDDFIKKSSKEIFSYLHPRIKKDKTGELSILKILAENGPLNQKEIGELTLKSYPYFDRWGVLRRFEGRGYFRGLIPYEFVQSIKRNQKETKHELTLKGLLAILSVKKLEEVDLFKRYKKFLRHFNNDPRILRWSVNFIKSEIALILSYNVIQGLDWTNFKYVKNYWDEFKLYDEQVVKKFFIEKLSPTTPNYELIKREYLKLFYILDKCTSPINCSFNNEWYAEPLEINDPVRLYIDCWYLFIDQYKYGKYPIRDKWEQTDERTSFDIVYWQKQCNTPMIEASRILENHGFIK